MNKNSTKEEVFDFVTKNLKCSKNLRIINFIVDLISSSDYLTEIAHDGDQIDLISSSEYAYLSSDSDTTLFLNLCINGNKVSTRNLIGRSFIYQAQLVLDAFKGVNYFC